MSEAADTREHLLEQLNAIRSRLDLLDSIGTSPDGDGPEGLKLDGRPAGFSAPTTASVPRSAIDALRESEERFKTIVESAPEAVFLIAAEGDRRGSILLANPAAEQMHGYGRGELAGKSIASLDSPEAARHVPERLRRLLAGERLHFEIEHVRKDGSLFPVEVTAARVMVDGKACVIAFDRDITERRRVEEALRASEQRFRQIIEHAPEAVMLLDSDTARFLMVNPATERMLKLSSSELCRCTPADVSPHYQPDGEPSSHKARRMLNLACEGKTPVFDWVHRDAEGQDIFCEVRLLSLEVEGKTVIRGSATDITEQRRAEASLRKMEFDLAHVARISTIGEMVGGLAHELNQPLYAIQNFGKACENLIQDESRVDFDLLREWLRKIAATTEYAGEVLLRLRQFVNREPMKKVAVAFDDIVESAVALTRYDAREKGVRVHREIPDGTPEVVVDAVQIQQVLVNLLRNAFEATSQVNGASAEVAITAETTAAGVEITVADKGPGLPKEGINIFEAFRSTKPGGMGLGLAIGRTIIEAHGGTLTAVDGREGGAEFRFTLPIGR